MGTFDTNRSLLKYILLGILTFGIYDVWVLARAGEPLYGYLIAKELERVGEGVLSGKQSALYPVLRNLEGAGLLESHVEPSSSGPPRRYYRINERGREVLAQWRQAWQATRDSVDSVLEGVPQ